ncbi:hypothetical protein [Bosea sp. CRIB-10]|uniref:hypothetical protein n=1 Tax=Bosea sp. CRIB-10 TaxID=378404 RepID=UPI001113984B|nr:hypothetical protein [Bosea sp. CRIB-10]
MRWGRKGLTLIPENPPIADEAVPTGAAFSILEAAAGRKRSGRKQECVCLEQITPMKQDDQS